MPLSLPSFLRWSPRVRKLAAVAVLGGGLLLLGRTLEPVAPRETELRVRLTRYRDAPVRARAASVAFARDGQVVRMASARFGAEVPAEWRQTLSLPVGEYEAQLRVELDGRAVARSYPVRVRAGGAVELAAPPP